MMYYTWFDTPAGMLLFTSNGKAITGIHWKVSHRRPRVAAGWIENKEMFSELTQQLTAYFAGQRREFKLTYAAAGTPFQRRVWEELVRLPYGYTCTYQELATEIGRPKAARTVATAIGSNPMSIVVPCHRVLGAEGRITGYAGGKEGKALLLQLENIAYKA